MAIPSKSPNSPKATATTTITTTPSPMKRQSLHTAVPRRSQRVSSISSSVRRGGSINTTKCRGSITRFSITPRDMKEETSSTKKENDTELLPLECLKQEQYLNSHFSFLVFVSTYLFCVLALYQLVSSSVLFGSTSELNWTITNTVHCIVTLIYIHWKKGSLLLSDEQGILNGMTVWEQLETTPESSTFFRYTLQIVPTIITYIACVTANYTKTICVLNIALWLIIMTIKLPYMNGVRVFGINRTAGIDDDDDNNNIIVTDNNANTDTNDNIGNVGNNDTNKKHN